ncbi:protein of unknown function (DUF4153) [Fodinibius salinus]|uniref:DUF4153 domain-containing protein n=1 Tax=Fodinibius salinus TaxID=860790 RepID=A0A5D3YIN2_9BACT|nr:DUF4153 domain-containing protein [Fodinibius salinus]TYP92100.1 protein of unknown function (DUF4153) [Fodinibius salinus]
MNFPSLNQIIQKSSKTLQRFPLALVSAFIATFTAIYLADLSYEQTTRADHLYGLIMVTVLGIALFTVIQLICEKAKASTNIKIGSNIVGVGLLVGYYFLLPADLHHAPNEYIFRYILYVLAVHLLVAVGPYWNSGEMSEFWQYNKSLFLRLCTAILFSAVLYVGLTIAMASINVLLEIDIDPERYFQLFAFTVGIFNTWFFLAGIPKSFGKLSETEHYPKGLKIFTRNILIPLVVIYTVILYLYMGKIIVEWSWPQGWVAYLVLSFSIVGIFALLLLHPIREKVENKWIKGFSKIYFWALVPLVILLLLSIWVRIDEYNFTINRYFVLALGLWLTGIVSYFIVSKTKNIKVIPASLFVTAVLVSLGPWSAFSVAEQSQTNRLERYLTKHQILANGTIQKSEEPVPFEDRKEISSIIHYLHDSHGITSIQPWFEQDLTNLRTSVSNADSVRQLRYNETPKHIVELMGIEYVQKGQQSNQDSNSYQFSAEKNNIIPVQQYDWIIDYPVFKDGNSANAINIDGDSLYLNQKDVILNISLASRPEDTLKVDFQPLFESLSQNYKRSSDFDIPQEEMMIESLNEHMQTRFYISSIHFKKQDSTVSLTNLDGKLLLKLNR